jgi:sirohydrochlorin ferrochelatase
MTTLDALQTALAAEHAAVYVYGALGARTSESASPVLFAEVADAYGTHRAWRDLLTRRLVDAGAEPTPAAATYDLPPATPTAAAVARAALDLELACARTYAYVVAETVDDDRRWAVAALTRTAVREVLLGGAPAAFPGADDLG